MGIGRKGRSCAWPPSRGVTSKSPMHAGAASSLSVHARFARRARQRRRVYQSGKGTAANRRGTGMASGPIGGRCAARGIYRARRRVSGPGRRTSFSFAGRSAVFRRRRFGPALLREAPRCSCLAVACGDRGVSDSTWAGGLLFGADGVAATVSRDRVRPGMPPRPPRLPQAPRQSRLRCRDFCCVPSCPAHLPNVSRGRRLPCLDVHPARGRAPGASGSIRPRRPSIERHGASVPTRVHLPPQLRHTRVSRHCALAPRRRHPRAMACRAHAGFPPAVWSPSLSGWLPTTPPQGGSHMAATIAPAPKRHQRNLR